MEGLSPWGTATDRNPPQVARILSVRIACLVALTPQADAIKVTTLTTDQVLFHDGFESVLAYTGKYLPG